MQGRLLLAALVLALALAPPVEAQGQHAVRLSVVAYHPFPDSVPPGEGGDPFGFPTVEVDGRAYDWMAAHYGAYYFPTVRFDGLAEEANRPDSNAATYHEAYRRHVATRLAEESPVVLRVNGTLADRNGTLSVRATAMTNLSGERLALRVALVEDDVGFAGGNGVDVHRFVARARLPDHTIAWTEVGDVWVFEVAFGFTVGAGHDGLPWRQGFLGAVAWVQKEDEVGRLAPREVVQSATYLFREEAASVQVEKAVLLEMYTATWCEACVFGDGAVELLLDEFGVASSVEPLHRWTYFRPPAAGVALLALAVGAPAAWLLTRRMP